MNQPTRSAAVATGDFSSLSAYVLMFLLILAGGLHTRLGLAIYLEAGFYFVPIFFLAVRGTQDSAPIVILILGLVKDLIAGTPIGFWAFLFCVFYILIRNSRQFLSAANYMENWMIFTAMSFITYLLAVIIGVMRADIPAAFWHMMAAWICTILAYPLIAIFFRNSLPPYRWREE